MQFASLAATAVSALGSLYGGQTAYAEGRAASRVAEQNARSARLQAGAREDLIRSHNRQRLGQQRAAAVQSGFDANTGSLAGLQADSAGALERDALNTRYEGALQALSFENQASALRRQAHNAKVGGYLNAAGSLLSVAGQKYGGGSSFDPGGYNGTNDRGLFSVGSSTDWHTRYGRGAD